MKPCWSARAFTAASLLLLVLCMAGCDKSLYGWQVRTNSTPVAPSFDRAPIDQMRVAILPTLSTGLLQGTAAGMSQYLDQTLKTLTPTWTVVTEQDALTRINAHGLGMDYVRMRSDAEQSHLLIRQPLAKIGAALGVRYVFQPRLAAFTQTMTERWKFPGLDLRLVETRASLLRLSLQLWEAESGALIWSSAAETIMENEALNQDPVFFEDAVRLTFGSLVSDFLNRRTASKYTPLNEVLDTLVQTAIPKEQPNKGSEEMNKRTK